MAELSRQEISRLVREYHGYHHDSKVRYCRKIVVPTDYYNENGEWVTRMQYTYYLVHFENCAGEKYSALDVIFHDAEGKPYVSEMYSCPREKEDEMIASLMEVDDELD